MAAAKPRTTDGLFPLLDWCTKKKGKLQEGLTLPGPFLINRWLSMGDPVNAHIINATINRWIGKIELTKDALTVGKFYHAVLPKTFARPSYIKKASKSTSADEDIEIVASGMECSTREVELHNKTLAELKKASK